MKSKVYFADMRASFRESLPQKLTRLIDTAGLGKIDMAGKFVAIKLHFGEPGNLAYLRPNYARAVADYVRERGGKPRSTISKAPTPTAFRPSRRAATSSSRTGLRARTRSSSTLTAMRFSTPRSAARSPMRTSSSA